MKFLMMVTMAASLAMLSRMQAQPQAPPRDQPLVAISGTAVISGAVVTDDEQRTMVRRATVTLTHTGVEDMRVTATDDQGAFRFDALPAGTFQIGVSKGAYVATNYGAPKPGMAGRSITLSEGQRFVAAPIPLMRGAVIGGRLTGRLGRPVQSAVVTAAQVATVGGVPKRRNTAGGSGSSRTDAHGEYRIYGLLPGEYLIYVNPLTGAEIGTSPAEVQWAAQPGSPAPPKSRPFGYAPTLFPGTADAGAGVPVAVGKSEERLGVDFAVQYVPLSRVVGVVNTSDGHPAAGATVLRTLRQPSELLSPAALTIRTPANGAFVFPEGITPGAWVILARGPELGPGATWGWADLSLSGQDVSDVTIALQPGLSVSGRVDVRAAGQTNAIDMSRIQLRLQSVDPVARMFGGSPSAGVSADGTFKLSGAVPGSWKLTATIGGSTSILGPWFVRSAMLDGRDMMDVPIEIRPGASLSGVTLTIADSQTVLSGQVTDSVGASASQVYVSVFSTDRVNWTQGSRRVTSVRATDTGAYSIAGLPAGEYYLCALTELDATLQYEPEYLEQLITAAIKITLAEGEKKQQNLRIGG
jgi:hypothetical protein